MEFSFSFLKFRVQGEQVRLCAQDGRDTAGIFTEVNVAGENRDSHLGNKMICSSQSLALKYVSHTLTDNTLVITQKSALVETRTHFFRIENTVGIYTEVENIAEEGVVIDEASAFVFSGFCGDTTNTAEVDFYRFTQSHHGECQPRKENLYALGLFKAHPLSQKRVHGSNVGGWSTKEELPQGILTYRGRYYLFQIESNHSWYYEISDAKEGLYLYLGGPTGVFHGWHKRLEKGEVYRTVNVALACADSLNGVLGEITKYRRQIRGRNLADEELPTIFNEYMHLSWDSPSEEKTKRYVEEISKFPIDYYVIDCGWHDDVGGEEIYPRVGVWKESLLKFPNGVRATTDNIRAHGMKAGLWIEPEIIGERCEEMLAYYDEDCFLHRYGKRVCVMGRLFLNFRSPKVVAYLNETIRRMVEEYGAEYIKMDYNQELGIGADFVGESLGEGLEEDRKAYLEWIDRLRERYPSVLIETCSSGGMRMDYQTLRHFSIVSTSDQIDYRKYPYIAANILSAVLPEQAAVWSYPVAGEGAPGEVFEPTKEEAEELISCEQVAMNMVNSLIGRMHLASRVGRLSAEKQSLIQEGIEYYKRLVMPKKEALPYLPLGFSDFHQTAAASGFIAGNKIYLAVWNLGGEGEVKIPLDKKILSAKVAYPQMLPTDFSVEENVLKVCFTEKFSARFFELDL